MKHKLLQLFQKNKHISYLVLGLITLLVFVCYGGALNAPFIIDDTAGIVNNPNIGKFSWLLATPQAFFANLTFYLAYKIGGLSPIVFRMFNIAFHIGAVFTLYLIIKRLFSLRQAIFTSVLFAIHPIFTESVTWISAMSYPKYSFFFLLTILSYIYGQKNKRWYVASIVFALLSILSSEKAVALPPVLFLLEWVFFSVKNNWKRFVPHTIIIIAIASIYLMGIGARSAAFQKDYYITKQFYNPIEHVPYAVTYYLQLIFFPKDLTVYHSELSITMTEFMIRWAFFIVFIVSIAMTYKKSKSYFFWALFFLITLAPSLIPLNIVWIVAERYVYLGAVGVMALLGYGITKLSEIKKFQTVFIALFTAIILSLIGRTIIRNVDWLSPAALWTSTIQVSPSSSNAHNNMGDVYANRKDWVNAAKEFQAAIVLQPGDADPRHNLGITLTMMGKYEAAVEAYSGALQISPTLYKTHQNLGFVFHKLQNYPEAEYHLVKALEFGPPNPTISEFLKEIRSLMGK